MVRRPFFLLAFGLSGCLLYTDPINDPPSVRVTVRLPDKDAHRNQAAMAVADLHDAQDGAAKLKLSWAPFDARGTDDACTWVDASTWNGVQSQSGNADHTFTVTPTSLKPLCLCARVLDSRGAAGYGCAPLRPVNRKPVADLREVTGLAAGQTRPLYSLVHLTAEKSMDPDDEPLQFSWSLQYTGSDPAGSNVKLDTCASVASSEADRHRCFAPQVPGPYRVMVKVTDSQGEASDPVSLDVLVGTDMPPCLQRTDPDLRARRIMLSRANDLGGKYESRTFVVSSVSDDGEPYPQATGSTRPAAQFVWYIKDLTATAPKWQQRIETSPSLTVSQADFPRALPGDTVQLRVEVRDTLVQQAYATHAYEKLNHGGWPCALEDEMCCEGGDCSCVRWTTWTIQFQP